MMKVIKHIALVHIACLPWVQRLEMKGLAAGVLVKRFTKGTRDLSVCQCYKLYMNGC
jgi:hypothetical protein